MNFLSPGLCLEKVPVASPSLSNYNVDKDQEVITCYEKSGDIALLYLQEVEKVTKQPADIGFTSGCVDRREKLERL